MVSGFWKTCRANAEWAPTTGPAAVIGAGGAARAVIAALIEADVPEIRLSNRTRARAEVLKDEFGASVTVVNWEQADQMFDGARTVVNTTSLGMVGKPAFTIPLDDLSPDAVVTDLVYTPLRTRFLEAADKKGCQTVDGLGMLLYQAVPGFERWFGHTPQVDQDCREHLLSR